MTYLVTSKFFRNDYPAVADVNFPPGMIQALVDLAREEGITLGDLIAVLINDALSARIARRRWRS